MGTWVLPLSWCWISQIWYDQRSSGNSAGLLNEAIVIVTSDEQNPALCGCFPSAKAGYHPELSMTRLSLPSILQGREDVAAEKWWPHSCLRKESSEGPTGTMRQRRKSCVDRCHWEAHLCWDVSVKGMKSLCHWYSLALSLCWSPISVAGDERLCTTYCQNICLLLLSEHFPLVCLINTGRQLTEMFHFKPEPQDPRPCWTIPKENSKSLQMDTTPRCLWVCWAIKQTCWNEFLYVCSFWVFLMVTLPLRTRKKRQHNACGTRPHAAQANSWCWSHTKKRESEKKKSCWLSFLETCLRLFLCMHICVCVFV